MDFGNGISTLFSMELSPDQRIAKHKSFLNANWELIASFSWEHFQKEGRGMVVVPEEDFLEFVTPQLKGLRFSYASQGTELLLRISTHFGAKEWGWLDTYDPDECAIVIIIREGDGSSGYLIGGEMKPSEAWTRQLTVIP